MMMKDYKQAELYWNESSKINEGVNDTSTTITIKYNKGILAKKQKEYQEAEKYLLT